MPTDRSLTLDPPQSLQQLQSAFKQYLFDDDEKINTLVSGESEVLRATRLGIYQNAYYLRLIDSLKQDYSLLESLLGEEAFTQLALAYIRTYPSVFPSLRQYGAQFAQYMLRSRIYRQQTHLIEIARLQWALIEAFDAMNQPALGEGDFAQVPADKWPYLLTAFHGSVQVLLCETNAIEIYSAIKHNKSAPEVLQLPQPVHVLVWRQNLVTRYRSLQHDEAALLHAALKGMNFSALCEVAASEMDVNQAALQAVSFLKRWLMDEMITAIHYDSP